MLARDEEKTRKLAERRVDPETLRVRTLNSQTASLTASSRNRI